MIDTLIEVKLNHEENFLKVRETLQRIGIDSKRPAEPGEKKKLFQSCHILHKKNRYYIVHFKELFALDGKPTNFTDEDKGRRNTICGLLEQWGLITVVNPTTIENPKAPLFQIKIISHKEKPNWELVAKYNVGQPKKYHIEIV